jgi:hypothetical protein
MRMTGVQAVKAALDPLGYDVRRWPGKTGDETYIALTVLGAETGLSAGNRPRRRAQRVQADLYSLLPTDTLCDRAVEALEAAGCPVSGMGPELYETDTKYHHMPIICQARFDPEPDAR